jgi:type IV secretion system protein TrbL
LVSGAPQLGAGAAVGTAGGLAGAVMLAGGAGMGGVRLLGAAGAGGLSALRAATAMGSAASSAYRLGPTASEGTGARGGSGAGGGRAQLRRLGDAITAGIRVGRQTSGRAMGGGPQSAREGSVSSADAPAAPEWARRLRAEQRTRHNGQLAAQAVKDGDRPGAPANPELDQKED